MQTLFQDVRYALRTLVGNPAFSVLTTVGLVDTWLLYRFFGYRRVEARATAPRASASTLLVSTGTPRRART